jgi:hypothetical protein
MLLASDDPDQSQICLGDLKMAYQKSNRKNSPSTNNLSIGTVGVCSVDELYRKFPPAAGEIEKINARRKANERREVLNLPVPTTSFDREMLGEMGIVWWDQVSTDDGRVICGNA